jgi:peptidoglycan L-alanyl-D-glutamate endopeptidase CwlK
MGKFSGLSKHRLDQCHEKLQDLFNKVVEEYDCTVICGFRTKEDQDEAFRSGKSKIQWPDGKHNQQPSLAVDVVPFPIDWNDKNRFYHFGGYVLGIASSLGIKVRWGGDWNGNLDFKDQNFHDLPHFELILDDN